MSHQVALSFEDGVTRFITCEDGQTVADASYRARINIPLDCRDGACGTCKAFCESGEFDGGSYIDDALTADEASEGYCLPCQMKPKSDLVLQIPSTSAVAKTQATTYDATVSEVTRLSETVVRLGLDVDGWEKLDFLPGQYVNIAVPGSDETRSYSFANGPRADHAEFLVKLTPGGVMSTYLDERAQVGDRLTITGPNGSFFLRDLERPALLLAGGTGLAPVLSMLRTLQHQGSSRKVHVVYGTSSDVDLVELDTLEAISSELSGVTWDYVVSDDASTAPKKGYVTHHISDEVLYDGDVAVYVCGPPPMVDAVRAHFKERNLELTGFYFEKFALAASGGEQAQAQAQAPIDEEQSNDAATETRGPSTEAPRIDATPNAAADHVVELVTDPQARAIAGQVMFERVEDRPSVADLGLSTVGPEDDLRGMARQVIFGTSPTRDAVGATGTVSDDDTTLLDDPQARGIARQEIFGANDLQPLVIRPAPATAGPTPSGGRPFAGDVATGGYQIGEEHADIVRSDAVFEARHALELGALDLSIGKVTSSQIAGWRLLAEATLPYVEGETFVDAAGYSATNALFHDYLFTMTGNPHLLEAYQRLGVRNHMDTTLSEATWCHPDVATEHVDIVDAVAAGDRERARDLILLHSEHAKETTRRAMREADDRIRPRWVSAGRFDDTVVVVTGAAQGIGEAVARRIAAEGGQLVLADRSELVESVAQEVTRLGPGRAVTTIADLETHAGAAAVVAKAIAEYGRVDVAVHNVGGAIAFKPFVEFTPEQIDAEISRSLMPTLYGCHAVLPHMIEAGRGTIVNVSSIATGGIHRVPYAAAKGGVNAITRALAVEAADHGVRVVATAPGGTQAPPRRIQRGPAPQGTQEQEWFQAHIDQTLDTSLMHRYGTLDEQAAAICFLASAEAGYVTGSVLPVGGGDLG